MTTSGNSKREERLLVVAGEASGDRVLAEIVDALCGRAGPVSGLGGRALEVAGAELVDRLERFGGAMGLVELLDRVPALATAWWRLFHHVHRHPPSRALLASFSSANARIGPRLRRAGVDVTWVGPPEVWAYRPERLSRLVAAASRFVVLLPFERALWQGAGARAEYLGHPVLSQTHRPRAQVRAEAGLSVSGQAVALLPGSRAQEVRRLLPKFLEAVRVLGVPAAILLSGSLPERASAWCRLRAREARIPILDIEPREGAYPALGAFDAALVAAGTATLECAAAGVPPVIVQTLHPATYALARRMVMTPLVGLPNVLLSSAGERPTFPECTESVPTIAHMVAALELVLTGSQHATCHRVREILAEHAPAVPFARAVGDFLLDLSY